MEVYFFGLNGIVIKSHGGSTLGVSQTPSIPAKKLRSKSCTLKIKQTIASALDGAATSGGCYGLA
jgi:hypothetical protein